MWTLFEWDHMIDFIGQHLKRKTAKQLEPVFRMGSRSSILRGGWPSGKDDHGASERDQSHEPWILLNLKHEGLMPWETCPALPLLLHPGLLSPKD